MLVSMFWIYSPSFDVDAFLEQSKLTPTQIWQLGEADNKGNPQETTGCSICVSDATDWEIHLTELDKFLTNIEGLLADLTSNAVRCSIDIGITVGDEKQFTRNLRFPPSLLERLGVFSIELELSAYPCSED